MKKPILTDLPPFGWAIVTAPARRLSPDPRPRPHRPLSADGPGLRRGPWARERRSGRSLPSDNRFFSPFTFWAGIVILGAALLAALICPASASAQAAAPPPVHSFDPEQSPGPAEVDSDELILMDFFQEAAEGSSLEPPPLPSLPPPVVPATSAPPTDSEPPAGPPLVNIPPIQPSAEERNLSAPLEPPTANSGETPAPAPTPIETAGPAQEPAPAETASPDQVPAGYTPLPTVPLQQPAAAPGPDPFTLPLIAEPETSAAEAAVPAEDLSVPLGQTRNVPAPQWERTDPGTSPSQSQVISGAPLPQFDSSQSPWIQLEIGQGDGSGPAPAAGKRPTSIYSLPDPAAGTQPPSPQPSPAEAAAEAATDQALDQAISQPPAAKPALDSPARRQHLRNVFSDMNPSDSESFRAPITAQPAAGGPAPPAGAAPPVGPLPQAPETAAAPAQAPGPDEEGVGSSSILRAGGLLTVEEQFGAAEILPPLSGRPRWPSTGTQTPAKAAPESKAVSTKPEPPSAAPAVKAAPAQTAPKPTAKAAAAPTAPKPAAKSAPARPKKGASKKSKGGAPPLPAGLGLIIINETGRERVGQQYRSVLAQMGYKVVSVGDGRPGRGPAGQTVINYRPGLKAKAQAVARHLPGKKVLVEAAKGQVLASEIMIYIR